MHSTKLKGAMNVVIQRADKCHNCSFVSTPDGCLILKMAHKVKMFIGVIECEQFQQREREPLIEKGPPDLKIDETQNFTSARIA